MGTWLKYTLVALALCTLGLAFSTPAYAWRSAAPIIEQPQACGTGSNGSAPCHRWYSLNQKRAPDACMGRSGSKEACSRWFAVQTLDVKFDFDSAKIKPESYRVLDKEVAKMKRNNRAKVTIVGHADAQGNSHYNKRLSKARANSVMKYFIQQGISPSRMATSAKGETLPVASNSTSEGRAENRRTELYLD